MYTKEAILDIHARAHRSLERLISHCESFSGEELSRKHSGFGYECIRVQLQHAIGAQRYWIGVLEGRMDVDEDPADAETTASLQGFRQRVFDLTASYLRAATAEELNTPRPMEMWGDQRKTLTPAHVVLRTLTHFYQHQGQVAAMCRRMGRPIPPGLDFPLLDV